MENKSIIDLIFDAVAGIRSIENLVTNDDPHRQLIRDMVSTATSILSLAAQQAIDVSETAKNIHNCYLEIYKQAEIMAAREAK